VSQISPPVRILLAGAVIFLAAWFTVLRPKAATVDPPAPVSTPAGVMGGAVGKAKGAAATAEGAAKAAAGEPQTKTESGSAAKPETAAADSAKPQTPAVAIPASVLAKLPHDVSKSLKQHDTIVLGVIADGATELRPLADDDRYVRQALRKVNRYDGEVLVKTVPVGNLARFAPLVGDLQVNQTPSVVVVDRDLKARVLTGYVDKIAINQAIADARRDSIHPLISDPYLRTLNTYCAQYITSIDRWSLPTISGKKARNASLDRRLALAKRYHADLLRMKAPAKWRGLKSQFTRVLGNVDTSLAKQIKAVKANDLQAYVAAYDAYDWQADRKLDQRFDQLGVTGCVWNRRS
jgi:hypothetical protein